MEHFYEIGFVVGWIFTWWIGWKIMKWKHRWTAMILVFALPYIGVLFAIFLDQRCRWCESYISMAATVCPLCGRTIKTGNVDMNVKSVAGASVKAPPESPKSGTKVVYDPETHQYVKR